MIAIDMDRFVFEVSVGDEDQDITVWVTDVTTGRHYPFAGVHQALWALPNMHQMTPDGLNYEHARRRHTWSEDPDPTERVEAYVPQ